MQLSELHPDIVAQIGKHVSVRDQAALQCSAKSVQYEPDQIRAADPLAADALRHGGLRAKIASRIRGDYDAPGRGDLEATMYSLGKLRTTHSWPEIHKFVQILPEVTPEHFIPEPHQKNLKAQALASLVDTAEEPTERAAILRHARCNDLVLAHLAEAPVNNEERSALLAHSHMSDDGLAALATNTKDSSLREKILTHPNTGERAVRDLGLSVNTVQEFEDVLEHGAVTDNVLKLFAFEHDTPQAHQLLLDHPNAGPETLYTIGLTSGDPLVREAAREHRNATDRSLSVLARTAEDPREIADIRYDANAGTETQRILDMRGV